MSLSLQPLSGDSAGGRKPFPIPEGPGSYTVGRSGENDLCVDDISVSGLHARIESSVENGVTLVDCQSSNGTFVNGTRIENQEIAVDDLVRFASLEFKVVESEVPAEETQALAAPTGKIPPAAPAAPVVDWKEKAEELERELESISKEKEELSSARDRAENETKAVQEERDEKQRALEESGRELEQTRKSLEQTSGRLEETKRNLELRERDLADAESRVERVSEELSKEREGNLQREGQIASLQFELTRRDGIISTTESESARHATERDEWQVAHGKLQESLEVRDGELAASQEEKSVLEGRLSALLERISKISESLLADWKDWFVPSDIELETSDADDRDLEKIDRVRRMIREQLDLIEPIWHEFGAGVQDELKRRCDELEQEKRDLVEENAEKTIALETTTADLTEVREKVDEAVRRAQGLSRRGTEVAIPENFESMVIAKDREQEVYRRLIVELEFYDHLLKGYRRNRKMKEALPELEEFRKKLDSLLKEQGVEEFDFPVGTMLTLRQRREVQILGRKGWGTREYHEQPYQPGEITKVIRLGYRIGEGDQAVVLRKVEVLIREAAG